MIRIFLYFLLFAVMTLLLYYLVAFVISVICGISIQEAHKRIHEFWTYNKNPRLEDDQSILEECQMIIRSVIGENCYKKQVESYNVCIESKPFGIFTNALLPYYFFSIKYTDEAQKQVLEQAISKKVRYYLSFYGFNTPVFIRWAEHFEMKVPLLVIYFARNDEELKRLRLMMLETTKQTEILEDSDEEFRL